MAQLATKRPEKPLKQILAALNAVDATANRDPEHLQGLVVEAFATGDRMASSPVLAPETGPFGCEADDRFDPMAVRPLSPSMPVFDRSRRGSVSAESYDPARGIHEAPKTIPKTVAERTRLAKCLASNLMMKSLPETTRTALVDAMFERQVRAGEDVIVQGDAGDNFYVVETGAFSILIAGRGEVNQAGPGQSFGELALMYNQPRQATVRAVSDSVVWGLDGPTFRKVMIDIAYRRRMLHKDLLSKVKLFATLSAAEVARIAEALVPISYAAGETILQQGDLGQEFFIIAEGETSVTQGAGGTVIIAEGETSATQGAGGTGAEVNRLGPGDYFGELALLTNAPRSATVTALTAVQCLILSRSDFNRLMGPLVPYLERNSEHYKKYQKYMVA